jgi:secondary thiamine-phosphate synthase enzyme
MPAESFTVTTDRRRSILDITDTVAEVLREMAMDAGLVCISVPHCTCCVYVNENEAGLLEDTLLLLENMGGHGNWRHDRIDNNADAHLCASVVGNSVTLPVRGGRMELGTWQRVMLVELDGPRTRRITVTAIGDG